MSLNAETVFTTCDNINHSVETILRLMLEEIYKQNAVDGMQVVAEGETYDATNFYAVIPREDTVVSMLRIGVDDVRDDYNIIGETLLVTDPAIMAPKHQVFTSITVASGSVWVLKHLA